MSRIRLALLGATGSIGTQTLDVVRKHADLISLVAVAANTSAEKLVNIAEEFGCTHVALADESAKGATCLSRLEPSVNIAFGAAAVEGLTQLDNVDVVLNSLSGEIGMRASYATLKSKRKLALANKESLVVAGDLIMPLATPETLLPVDSEHSAIFQCLIGEDAKKLRRIWLTCSGGPFRGLTLDKLSTVDASQALAHPTWSMGAKISIDSATLMNKGLEVIEAKHLFAVGFDDIRIVVHPQSCIHSMVEYVDGSVKAHLGVADMRIPIQFALTYPDRLESPAAYVDFAELVPLEFFEPDFETFRCLALAIEAGKAGGTLPCAMNAANEVAVAAFLAYACSFIDIASCVESVMERHAREDVSSLEQLEAVDAWARSEARARLGLSSGIAE